MMTLFLLCLFLLGALAADWPWRSRNARAAGALLRVVLVCFFAFDLYMNANIGIGRAWRHAVSADDPVTSAPPAFPTMSPYVSGVSTMRREAEEEVETINPGLLGLLVMGVTPVLRLRSRRQPLENIPPGH